MSRDFLQPPDSVRSSTSPHVSLEFSLFVLVWGTTSDYCVGKCGEVDLCVFKTPMLRVGKYADAKLHIIIY